MTTYKIYVDGYKVGEKKLTAEQIKKYNNAGIVVKRKGATR